MDKLAASISTPASTSSPAPSRPSSATSPALHRSSGPSSRSPTSLNSRPREIEPLLSPAPFGGPLFPSSTPRPSPCTGSSPTVPRIPSSPLGTPGPFFTVGLPRHASFYPHAGSPSELNRQHRHVLHSTPVPIKLAPLPPLTVASPGTIPLISNPQPPLPTVMSSHPDRQQSAQHANTPPPPHENATFDAMELDEPPSATGATASSPHSLSLCRYVPTTGEFHPDPRHIMSSDPESIKYWEGVLERCNAETRTTSPRIGGRDKFVIGSVVVKSDHLDPSGGSGYHLVDANEDTAINLARQAIPSVQLPQTYFRLKIRGHDVFVQSRIPGQTLASVWAKLTTQQKRSYKQQAREIISRLRQVTPDTLKYPRYFVAGSEKEGQRKLSPEEVHSLSPTDTCDDLGVAHNDMVMSNIIVSDDRIVGLIGWANAGYFNWRTVSKIHAKVRCIDSDKNALVPECFESEVPWHDLYELSATSNTVEAQDDACVPRTSTPTLESTPNPQAVGAPSQAQTLTPKKVADMKLKSASRASSVDRSSPAPSVNSPSVPKKKGPPAAAVKKGTAKRAPAAAKKRKLGELAEADDASTAKASPLSKTSAQRDRKRGSQSTGGSPAPETKGPKKSRSRLGKANPDEDDDDYDESTLFCICRKPDNHTWMIACDGGCEDWYHGKCVNIDQKDADLIDKYICPTCTTKSPLCTTWKPVCRLPECRQPARVDTKPPSKYCCDQHGIDYMKHVLTRGSRQSGSNVEDQSATGHEHATSSKGGALKPGELKTIVSNVDSAEQFRKLGASPLSVQQEAVQSRLSDAMAAPGPSHDGQQNARDVDFESEADKVAFSLDERQRLDHLRKEKIRLDNRKEMLQAREKFLGISKQRVKHAFDRLKSHGSVGGLQLKDICGFDNRLSLSEEEFDEWRKSERGASLLAGSPEDNGGEASTQLKDAVDAESIEELTQSLCLKKRCERHKQWAKVMHQDLLFEQSQLKEQSTKCLQDAEELVRKAVLRVFNGEN